MSGLRGNVASLKRFSAKLRELPRALAQKVATASAPVITSLALRTFAARTDPYGLAWLPGTRGNDVTLRNTGALAATIRYVAIGTKLRVVLGVPYAKYQVGRRPVFPRQSSALPLGYVRELTANADALARAELAP